MRILLHTCCAACAIGPWEWLAGEGHEVTALFYNPNIHPLIEFRRRLKALRVLQERMPIEAVFVEDYGLMEFMESVRWQGGQRCEDCYRLRLGHAARYAAAEGFEAFTTTLLSSTHQDLALLARVGRECAAREGVAFMDADWRSLAPESHARAKQLRLYMQNYCGCIFSEYERYKDTGKHIYRGPGA